MDAGRRALPAAARASRRRPRRLPRPRRVAGRGGRPARRARSRRLAPGAEVVVQLDEPSLPAVLAGALPTTSGFGRLRAVEEPVVVAGVETVLEAASGAGAVATVVHCCAADPPVGVLRARRRRGSLARRRPPRQAGWEAVAAAVEERVGLWAGVVPTGGALPSVAAAADAVWSRWRALGLDLALLAGVVLTPACGLAGVDPADARAGWPAPCRRRPRWRTGRPTRPEPRPCVGARPAGCRRGPAAVRRPGRSGGRRGDRTGARRAGADPRCRAAPVDRAHRGDPRGPFAYYVRDAPTSSATASSTR